MEMLLWLFMLPLDVITWLKFGSDDGDESPTRPHLTVMGQCREARRLARACLRHAEERPDGMLPERLSDTRRGVRWLSDTDGYVLLASGHVSQFRSNPDAPILRTKEPDRLGLYLVALADGRVTWTRSVRPGTVLHNAPDGSAA